MDTRAGMPNYRTETGKAWRYFRQPGVSKWVRGDSWVTKFDKHSVCAIGLNGCPVQGVYIHAPRTAREWINQRLSRSEQSITVKASKKESEGVQR